MLEWAPQYGRSIDPDEAGVVLLTHVSRTRAEADERFRRFARGFPAPAEALAARSVVGTAGECADVVRRYVEAGCTKFVLWPIAPPDELVGQVEAIGRDILPRFATPSAAA